MGTSFVLAGIIFRACSISAIEAKGSRVPWMNNAGVRRFGQMLGALLLGLARGMQRIGEQQQAGDEIGGLVGELGAEHAGLASAIGMAGEEDVFVLFRLGRIKTPTLSQRTRQGWGNLCVSIPTSPKTGETWGTLVCVERGDCVLQAGSVAGCVAGTGRAIGSGLAVRKIAAQDGESGGGESLGQSNEQRGLGVRAGAVGEDERIAVRSFRRVEESANWRIDGVDGEGADGGFGQGLILNCRAILASCDRCRKPARSSSCRASLGWTAPFGCAQGKRGRLSLHGQRNFAERLVDFHDLDFVAQAGPAAEHVGVFLGGAAGIF